MNTIKFVEPKYPLVPAHPDILDVEVCMESPNFSPIRQPCNKLKLFLRILMHAIYQISEIAM